MLLRRIGLAATAAVLALAGTTTLAPAGIATPAAHAAGPTVLRVGLTEEIDTLNPFLAEFASSSNIGRMMYEFLTTYDPATQQPVPALASSWSTSPDGKTWTYTIRSGAKWSDGVPITARDAAFTFNLMMTNTAAATSNGNFVQNFKTVTAPNDTTLVITTNAPQATMLALDVPIVPQHIWAHVSDIAHYTNLPTPGHPVVGSGPFVLTGYQANQSVTLTANKTYWRGAPKIDQLQYIEYDNANAEVAALIKGDIDLVDRLTPAQFNELKHTKNITTNDGAGNRFTDMVINPGAETNTNQPIGNGNPNLKDVRVRQAIAEAINPAQLVQSVYGGYAAPGTSYIPLEFTTYHWQPSGSQARSFNPTAANNLLDQAGYAKGTDGIRMGKDGKPLDLTLLSDTSQVQDSQMAAYIKSWLGAIGISVTVQSVSSDKLNDLEVGGDYDLAFNGYGVDPDPDYVLSIQTCSQRPNGQGLGGNTEAFFCDPQYDNLYNQETSDLNPATRVDQIKQLQQVLYQQAVEVPLLYQDNLEAYRSDRWAPFTVQPQPGGSIMFQNGYWSFLYATPLAAASDSGSSSAGLIIGIVVAVIVVAGVVFLFTRRRRRTVADDKE